MQESRLASGGGLLREVIGKAISGLFFYLAYIWATFDGRKQGWHDKTAGTYVIRKVR